MKEFKKGVKKYVVKLDSETKNRAIEIENKYKIITRGKNGLVKSKADPRIIAYAEKESASVYTREGNRKTKDEAMKIPDVCKKLNVNYERSTKKVLKELKFKKI